MFDYLVGHRRSLDTLPNTRSVPRSCEAMCPRQGGVNFGCSSQTARTSVTSPSTILKLDRRLSCELLKSVKVGSQNFEKMKQKMTEKYALVSKLQRSQPASIR